MKVLYKWENIPYNLGIIIIIMKTRLWEKVN